MTELAGHEAHDSYAYVQLRAVRNDLHHATMRIFALEGRNDALTELCRDLYGELGEDGPKSAWYEQRLRMLGVIE